jgi:GT2 family glycosyltransferase
MQIICIDNGSDDGSPESIDQFFREKMSKNWCSLTLIRKEKNIGAPKAYNIGFKKSLEDGADFIWKLDNDIYVEKDSLVKLIDKFHIDSKIGIAGSVVFPLYSYNNFVENYKGLAEIGCKINFFTTNVTKKMVKFDKLSEIKNNIFEDIDYSIGCSNLIKKDVFDLIGLLDEDFFLYYDDSYFAYLARKAGFSLLTATDSIVFHKGSASTGGIMKPLGIYYTTLSELLFFKKTMTKVKFLFYYPLIFFKRLLLTVYRLIKQRKIEMIKRGLSMFLKANLTFLKLK